MEKVTTLPADHLYLTNDGSFEVHELMLLNYLPTQIYVKIANVSTNTLTRICYMRFFLFANIKV